MRVYRIVEQSPNFQASCGSNSTSSITRYLKVHDFAQNRVLGRNFLTFALQFAGADVSFR
jgi:hypothetical protein